MKVTFAEIGRIMNGDMAHGISGMKTNRLLLGKSKRNTRQKSQSMEVTI